jgi:hypothetical protein
MRRYKHREKYQSTDEYQSSDRSCPSSPPLGRLILNRIKHPPGATNRKSEADQAAEELV